MLRLLCSYSSRTWTQSGLMLFKNVFGYYLFGLLELAAGLQVATERLMESSQRGIMEFHDFNK